jgi:hypothetical protein
MPDSLNSPLYKTPVRIDSNTTLLARAFKAGWKGSNESKASYIIRGIKPDSVELITPLDSQYRTASPTLLTDADLGDQNTGNGQWLGYRKNDAGFYFYFTKPASIHHVLLNTLYNTGASIFPPTKIEIWGGMDKDHLRLLGIRSPVMPAKNEPAALRVEKVSFEPCSVRVIKVVAQHLGKLPSWHPSKNKPAWVFISEVVMN